MTDKEMEEGVWMDKADRAACFLDPSHAERVRQRRKKLLEMFPTSESPLSPPRSDEG